MRDGSSKVLTDNALSFRSVRFSPNGQYVAAGNEDHVFRIWNIRTGQLMLRWTGHQNAVQSVAFTPDGKGLVSGGYDKKLKYWNISPLVSARAGLFDTTADVEAVNEEVLEFAGHTVCCYIITSRSFSFTLHIFLPDFRKQLRLWFARPMANGFSLVRSIIVCGCGTLATLP
jgi:WD40 repeat protein